MKPIARSKPWHDGFRYALPILRAILIWLLREVNDMLCSYTAKYTRLADGYMGQIVEWPEVVTEGADLDECRIMLRDALREMVLAPFSS